MMTRYSRQGDGMGVGVVGCGWGVGGVRGRGGEWWW